MLVMQASILLALSPVDDFCLYPRQEQQPTPTATYTDSTALLSWPPAMLPSNCTEVVTSMAPPDYTVEYSQEQATMAITVSLPCQKYHHDNGCHDDGDGDSS